MTASESARPANDGSGAARLADALVRHYRCEAHALARIAKGMGTTNWLVRTPQADYFLKQYPPSADVAGEAAALKLFQEARAAGLPVPMVIPSAAGELVWSEGDLALALFEYHPDTTSGIAPSRSEMAQAGHTLGRLHTCLRDRPARRDAAGEWLALDASRKRAAFERCLNAIEKRGEQNEFDRRTVPLLRRRLDLLPRAASLLASLPPLGRHVLHGDYSLWNILFRGGKLIAVVDFRPPERFLPAFEIGRAALAPEMVTAGPGWHGRPSPSSRRTAGRTGTSNAPMSSSRPTCGRFSSSAASTACGSTISIPSSGRPVSTGSGFNGAGPPT